MSDCILNFFKSLKKLIDFCGQVFVFETRNDESNVSSFPTAFRSGSRQSFINENFFLYFRYWTLRTSSLMNDEFINIICDFRLSVNGEKSYHVCHFRLLSLVSYRYLCFLLFLYSFFSFLDCT